MSNTLPNNIIYELIGGTELWRARLAEVRNSIKSNDLNILANNKIFLTANSVDISGNLLLMGLAQIEELSVNIINVNQTLNLKGTTQLQDLSAGATDISSTLTVQGITNLENNLFVAGITELQDLSAGATDISSMLNVKGVTNLENNLFVAGITELQDLSAGATDIISTLTVQGITTLQDNLILHGSFTINDTDLSQYLLESSSNKIYYRNNNTFPFDISQILITDADEKDCSNILYAEIQPTTSNKKIFISINFEYICSSAYQERITIKLFRDNTIIKHNLNLGTINSSGEYRGIYNVSLIDNPSTSNLIKYYIKFQLETNYYNTPLGLINLTNSASITLIEF